MTIAKTGIDCVYGRWLTLMYTSTTRRYNCNISDWMALVTGSILVKCVVLICHYYWIKTELLSFHLLQDSPKTVLVFTNIYKDIGTRVSKVIRLQRSGIDTIKYHTWPRIPMGKWQTHRRHHKREPRGQPFPSKVYA